ncbi:MAG: hypothetical protein EHM61_05755 [Acidobacteria bacterium]|nr:MAG: hypothetical protein EHM61_05755 [Acidobacteriota bacterium]
MGQRSDEIKKHIDNQRSELSENLEQLEERVKSTTDWRAQVERRPMTALGIAFGGGLLLGAMIPTGGRSRSKYTGSSASRSYTAQGLTGQGYSGSSEGTTGSYLEQQSRRTPKNTATSRELHKTWSMLDTVRASLIAFGATKLKDYLSQAIPGFGDHYQRTEEEQRRTQGWNQSSSQTTGTTSGSTGTTGGPQRESYSSSSPSVEI